MLEDDGDYLMEILLDCPDTVSRVHVGILVKFLMNKLKIIEEDKLY